MKDFYDYFALVKTYLAGKAAIICIGFFTALIFSLVGLATPYLTQFLIDVIFHEGRGDLLLPLLAVCGAVIVVMFLTGLVSDYLLLRTFEKAKLKMRYYLFNKLQKAPFSFLTTQRSGELNSRIFKMVFRNCEACFLLGTKNKDGLLALANQKERIFARWRKEDGVSA